MPGKDPKKNNVKLKGGSGKGGKDKGGKGKKLKAPNVEKQYRQEANVAARMQFRPQFQGLNRELESETRNAAKIPDYFQQYQDTLRGSQASTQQGFNTAASGVETRNDTSTQIDLQQQQKMRDEASHAAGISGGVADNSVSNEALLAALSRKAQADQAAARLRAIGASQSGTFGQLQATGQGAQIAAQNDSRLAIKDTNRDIRDLEGARGDYKAAYITDARNAARDFSLKQQALGVTAAGNKLSAKTSRANNAATTSTSRANNAASNATSRANNAASNAQSNTNSQRSARGRGSSSSTKGSGGATQAQKRSRRADIRKATATAAHLKSIGASRREAMGTMQQEGMDSKTAQKAANAVYGKQGSGSWGGQRF